MKTDPVIERYLAILMHLRKLSPHTLNAYRRDLLLLRQLSPDQTLNELEQHQLRLLSAQLHRKGYSPASIARVLSTWRGFYKWLVEDHGLSVNPMIGLRAPRRTQRLPKALSVEQAVTLSQYSGTSVIAIQNHAICELFYSSGLRLSELTQLDWRYFSAISYQSVGWFDLENAQVTILGKGGKRRIVPVGSHACSALQQWMKVRTTITRYPIDPYALFISPRGKRISNGLVYTRIKQLALAAGLPTHVHPHMLRHSCASHLLQSSGNLRAVQEILGHSSISSTQIYTALDFQHLAKVYDIAHPRAKRKVNPK